MLIPNHKKFKKLVFTLFLIGVLFFSLTDISYAKTKQEWLAEIKQLLSKSSGNEQEIGSQEWQNKIEQIAEQEAQKKKIEIECQKNPDACPMEPLVIDENGTVEGIEKASLQPGETPLLGNFSQKIKQALTSLGLTIENGIARIKELVAEKITSKISRTEKLEMVDQATGEIYCTWIENGEWVKVKGECQNESIQQTTNNTATPAWQGQTLPVSTTPKTPKVSLTASTSTCATGTEITFTATASNFATTTLTYAWDFGDGITTTATSTDTNSITHTYNATGTYTVSVTATAGTQTASTLTQITIVGFSAPNVTSTTPPETCASSTFYLDADQDGYGSGQATTTCDTTPPAGYATSSGDCDDASSSTYPGATEICGDGVDNNCNDQIDEDCATCATSTLQYCTTTDACVGVGGFWHKTCTSTNSVPVAQDITVSVKIASSTEIALSADDADGDNLTYTIISQPTIGVLSGAPPNLTYTPNATGTDSFTYKASDGYATSEEATANITVSE